jgi:hypothetical protein
MVSDLLARCLVGTQFVIPLIGVMSLKNQAGWKRWDLNIQL